MTRAAALLVLVVAACSTDITPPDDDVANYKTWWKRPDMPALDEPVPGHGDSWRTIWANPVARSHPQNGGRYPIGTIIVKEIADDAGDGPGDLRYVAVMRKLGDDTEYDTHNGWLFTTRSESGAESTLDVCWQCHKSAPYDATWFEYGE